MPEDGARYRAIIEIVHEADTLVMTEKDLDRDFRREIRELLDQMAARSARELEEEVYLKRVLRLCGPCRRDVLIALERPSRSRSSRRRPQRRPK